MALLVDGAEYFDAFAQAAERARHSILIVGWDFDSRAPLYRSSKAEESRPTRWKRKAEAMVRRKNPADIAVKVGDFLHRLARRRRRLEIHILIWDFPTLLGLDRDLPLYFGLGRRWSKRIHVRYDSIHPIGASHHQKIVVIDDDVAFCGGLDLTMRRWDTCNHSVDEPRRVAFRKPYPPFHDSVIAVSGAAARVLGDLARDRWRRATGEALEPVATTRLTDAWPPSVEPDLTNMPVAISRTIPPSVGHQPVREVEQLYLDMIGQAKDSILIENQYFTAERVGDALARRLQEKHGPEIILILRRLSHGWLEAMSMEALRTRQLRRLESADRHGHFRYFYPHVAGLADGSCIDVHSKLMVVDDEVLRIGSANLCNRSMGLDTECDLSLEAGGDTKICKVIADFRNRLLGEHLGVEPDAVRRLHERRGSLLAAIESLREDAALLEPGGRTLCEFDEFAEIPDALVSVAELADPEKPTSVAEMLPLFSSTEEASTKWPASGRWLASIAMLLVLAGALKGIPFNDTPWLPIALLLAYLPSAVLAAPRFPITLVASAALGLIPGFALAMTGGLLAACVSYVLGMRMSREALAARSGSGFGRISELFRRHDLAAIIAVRLCPLTPHPVAGMIAGAARTHVWRFLAGTGLGLVPGVALASALGYALRGMLDDTVSVNYWLVGITTVTFAGAAFWAQRWLSACDGNLSPGRRRPAPAS